jgi:hypothetical protein
MTTTSSLNKSLYSLSTDTGNAIVITPDQIQICYTGPGANLTPSQLKSYIDRTNAILGALVFTRAPVEQTLQRLDIIRQELSILSEITFRPLPPPPEVGISRTENGKLSLQNVFK